MVALGFAMSENILYYGKAAAAGGGEALTATFILRGFFAPFSHPLFTSMTGIGLGLARQSTNLAIKIITPIVGLLMAIFMHSIWNGSAVLGGGVVFMLTYILVMVPAFFIMLIVISLSLRREGQVVHFVVLGQGVAPAPGRAPGWPRRWRPARGRCPGFRRLSPPRRGTPAGRCDGHDRVCRR